MSAAAGELVRTGDDPNGLAAMMAELIRQNLERDPARVRLLEHPASYAITAHDIGLSVTMRVDDGHLEVANGRTKPPAEVRIRSDATSLLEFSAVPLRLGQPDVFTAAGRAAIGSLLRGRMRVRGLLRHPGKVARLNRLLSAT